MTMKAICPCPNPQCPNHGDCEKCTSRHARLGYLNYCGFHTILPALREAMADDAHSPVALRLEALIAPQLAAYEKLMAAHGFSHDRQRALLEKVAVHSDH